MVTQYIIKAEREEFFNALMETCQKYYAWQSKQAVDNLQRVYGNAPFAHAAKIYSHLQNADNTEPVRAEIAEIFGDRTIGDFERGTAEQGKFSFYIGQKTTYEKFINGDWFGFESEGVDAWIIRVKGKNLLTITVPLVVATLQPQLDIFLEFFAAELKPFMVAETAQTVAAGTRKHDLLKSNQWLIKKYFDEGVTNIKLLIDEWLDIRQTQDMKEPPINPRASINTVISEEKERRR